MSREKKRVQRAQTGKQLRQKLGLTQPAERLAAQRCTLGDIAHIAPPPQGARATRKFQASEQRHFGAYAISSYAATCFRSQGGVRCDNNPAAQLPSPS